MIKFTSKIIVFDSYSVIPVQTGIQKEIGIIKRYGFLLSQEWQRPVNRDVVKRGKGEEAKGGDLLWNGKEWLKNLPRL